MFFKLFAILYKFFFYCCSLDVKSLQIVVRASADSDFVEFRFARLEKIFDGKFSWVFFNFFVEFFFYRFIHIFEQKFLWLSCNNLWIINTKEGTSIYYVTRIHKFFILPLPTLYRKTVQILNKIQNHCPSP